MDLALLFISLQFLLKDNIYIFKYIMNFVTEKDRQIEEKKNSQHYLNIQNIICFNVIHKMKINGSFKKASYSFFLFNTYLANILSLNNIKTIILDIYLLKYTFFVSKNPK